MTKGTNHPLDKVKITYLVPGRKRDHPDNETLLDREFDRLANIVEDLETLSRIDSEIGRYARKALKALYAQAEETARLYSPENARELREKYQGIDEGLIAQRILGLVSIFGKSPGEWEGLRRTPQSHQHQRI